MSVVLSVKNLEKNYPSFKLSGISFNLESSSIMGLIGCNGAGKTTVIKSILNLIHIEKGEIFYFGKNLFKNENEIKENIGYAGGAVNYYSNKKISNIVKVTKTFYKNWDENLYKNYCSVFKLDENKIPSQLSEGMKVKLNLALALSHGAKILILDEPTSGLDPVSRDELLQIFCKLKKEGISILFSTHITSDLDKCADSITYIRKGKMQFSGDFKSYLEECKKEKIGNNLEEIMLYFEKSQEN